MGAAVSANVFDLSGRRRSSQGSRGSRGSRSSRLSVLRNPILDSPARRPSSPADQRRLSNPPPTKPAANATTGMTPSTPRGRKDSAQESSPNIIRDRRANSNTLNSLHILPPPNDADMNAFQESDTASRGDSTAPASATTAILSDIHVHTTNDIAPATDEEADRDGRKNELKKEDVEKSIAHSAPPTVMRRVSPTLPVHRSLRWADTLSSSDDVPTAIAASPPPTMNSFNPWGLRHTASPSLTDGSDQSKAMLATTHFKATYQRLCEEPRSRVNSTSVNKNTRTDSVGGRSSREERRTNSTQLSTDEWSHLLELMDTGNGLICVDDEMRRSQDKGKDKADALPAYPAIDTALLCEEHPLRQNASFDTSHANFSPLRMHFSATTSFLSAIPTAEMDLQRAISAVDRHAANLRWLLTSWQDICDHHFDAFVNQMNAVLVAKHHSLYGNVVPDHSASEHARMMLQMIGQAVQLVSQMEDMFTVLLEMGAMHRRNDVGAAHFEALHQAFMEVLPHHVPVEQRQTLCGVVWEPFWQVVVKLLTQGSASERGEWYALQRRAEWMAEARAVMEVVGEMQQRPEFKGSFIPAMLDRAIAVTPAMSQFFLMREPRTAIRSFEGLLVVALELDDDAARVRYIEQLAHEHIVYGLSEWGLRELRQPFIETAKHYVQLSPRPQMWIATAAESLGLFWDMLMAHWVQGIAVSRKSLADIRSLSAPSGSRPFCMMFTDIEASSRLWELYPSTMADAVDAHNQLLRRLISEHGAYEVKTDGDAFTIATKDVFTALQIAVAVQLELMRGPIAEGFCMVPVVQGGGLRSCWRADSLRVRVGIHYCTDASAVYDSVQRRFDYYGPSVNCAMRTAAAAAGGQILLTQAAVFALRATRRASEDSTMPIAEIVPGTNPMDAVLDSLLEFQWWGEQRFRGISDPVSLYSVLPMRLAGRTFPYYVGSRKVRVSAPSDLDGRKAVCRLSLAQLKCGDVDEAAMAQLRSR